jgi:hypothetical protein
VDYPQSSSCEKYIQLTDITTGAAIQHMSCRVPKFSLITIILILSVSMLLSLFALGGHSFYKNDIAHASSATTSLSANGAPNITLSPSSNSSIETSTGSSSLEYSARFLCGTIVGEGGPLRPGRYDSDINIFNRQIFPVSFTWKAVLSSDFQDNTQKMDEKNSNFILLTLNPGNSISISCNDVRQYLPAYSNNNTGNTNFLEGVLLISIELDPSIQGALSSSSVNIRKGERSELVIPSPSPTSQGSEPSTNILSVDAIYTVNALEVASREIVLQLIEYSITNRGESTKIPSDMMSRVLSVAVPIRTNETLNPDKQVRDILTREYSLSTAESQSLDILIRNLSLGVGALDDNHAISLQRINAYQPPDNLQ